MRNVYSIIADVAKRFFVATGIPVPPLAMRLHRAMIKTRRTTRQANLRQEVDALARAVERLETIAYLDRTGHPPD